MTRALLLCLCASLAGVGCSSEEPGPAAGGDALRTETAFCSEWAKAACNDEVVGACNGTLNGCRQTQKSKCLVMIPLGYSSRHAEACIDAVRDAYEDAVLSSDELELILNLGEPCQKLVAGTSQEGDTCFESFDCNTANDYDCVIKAGAADGTCQIPVEAPTGGSCTGAEDVCAEDAYCDGRRCLLREFDLPCALDEACPSDYRCDLPAGAAEGTCVELLDGGDVCTANVDCKSNLCLGATRKVCTSSVRLTVESVLCDDLR